MSLSGQQRKQLQDALIDAFPTTAFLERMLAFGLDKNLRAIAGEGSLQDTIFNLIQVANAEGWVEDLVRAAHDTNPGNKQLRIVAEGLPNSATETPPSIPQKQTQQLSTKTPRSTNRNVSYTNTGNSGYTEFDSELLIERRRFSRYDVQVTIHNNYALDLDDYLVSAFKEHNERRDSSGLHRHFPATRYRLICPPKIDGIKLKLDVAPINFCYFALLIDPESQKSADLKAYIDKKFDEIALRIPQELKSDHKYINEYNYIPLGVEIVLITNDGKTLLRRRGQSVATSRFEWDVSFSGYCGDSEKQSNQLQMWQTVETELVDEIDGTIPRDPSNIYFTTLHRNKITGATDLLGYWKVEISSEQLANLLADKYPRKKTKVFKTTKQAQEEFVWDTDNIIVDFDGNKIVAALKTAKSGVDTLMPEARVALNLALQTLGKPTLNL